MNSNWSYCPKTLNSGQNWWFFVLCDLEIWWMTLKKNRVPLLCYFISFVHQSKAIGKLKLKLRSGNAQFGSKSVILCSVWSWNLTDDLENNRAPLLCYFKLCASFHSHRLIPTKVAARKHSIRVKICDLLWRVTLKFDRWPWKTIGHLFYATSSFVYHLIAIGEFKLELQSGNAKFASKSTVFFNRVTLKLDRRPFKTIGHLS